MHDLPLDARETCGLTPCFLADFRGKSMCQAMCDQRLRCQGSVDSECTQRCVTKVGPPHILSRDALVLYEQCTRDPACLDDDDCEAAMRVRDPAVDKEMAACSAFVRTCPS